MKKLLALPFLLVFSLGITPSQAAVVSEEAIPKIFDALAHSPSMANPSIVVLDRFTGKTVYEYDSKSLRKPASVMKILSASAALEYLDSNKRFTTSVLLGRKTGSIIISGELDPWLAVNRKDAVTDHRTWIGYITSKAIEAVKNQTGKPVRKISIAYEGIYSADIAEIRKSFRSKGVITGAKAVRAEEIAQLVESEVVSSTSPTVATMVEFALTWSDNLLAERLARLASQSAGNPINDIGVSATFHTLMDSLGVEHKDLHAHDGSGLSKLNRVSAAMVADVLFKIRDNQKFNSLLIGLPVAGVTGTLKDRFLKSAPDAIGLVHAKTGTLNGTVSLAGYVESDTHEYIFVVIADRIPKTSLGTARARGTLDSSLGKIAAPFTSTISELPVEDSSTASTS